MKVQQHDVPFEYVFTKYITLRNGKRIYAAHYGKDAFRIKIRRPSQR